MRVMHVIESMATGGAESLIFEHVRLAGTGVESTVCALNRGGPAFESVRALGVPCMLLGKGGDVLGGVQRLAALMRERRIDVVNAHNPTGAIYGTAAARIASVPVVIRTEHSIRYPRRHSLLYEQVLEPLLTTATDAVVCICDASRRSMLSRLRWADGRFVTILNGISEAPSRGDRDRIRAGLSLDPTTPVVINVGSLTWQKAQDVLIDAFAEARRRVPGAVLLIAGEGRLRPQLEAQIAARGLGGEVRLLGNRGDVADLMRAADLFVLSSVREGLSVTLLEAMRASKPVVVTNIGGNPEVVVNGETGAVVPVREPGPLGEAIASMLGDPERMRRCGEAGRERWHRLFTAERMVRETEDLYRRLLARRRPAAAIVNGMDDEQPRSAAGGGV